MELKINDRIRNRDVRLFNQFSMNLRYDSVGSSFAFSGYFNPNNIEHKELYCVGHYHICTIHHEGNLLLTGSMITEGFNDSNQTEMAQFGGYSLPGVLEDCQISPEHYPLQFNGMTLREIVKKIIAPFQLTMVVDPAVAAEMDKPFPETNAEPGQTIKDYITSLAVQRKIVTSHNNKGHLLFTRARTKQAPIINYNGQVPFTSMGMQFNGQAMHSEIWAIKQADSDGGNAGQSMVKNPYVPFVYRPRVIIQNSGDDNDTEKVARMALSAELKNLKLNIVTDRWDLGNGKIILPNSIVRVVNPKVYIFKPTDFFVEEVSYKGDNKSLIATLTCCLPEVYNDEVPKYIYKGINIH
jgi:prophage tail gpP-like protein